ncbi:hypothetical protein AHAS_Ahas18G0199000 [Arachis hypogaea]
METCFPHGTMMVKLHLKTSSKQHRTFISDIAYELILQVGTSHLAPDDAIGEAYDKTAKWLGLNLKRSGGPAIDELAKEENAKSLSFLVPMKQHKDCNFSYAGLKTQGWQSNPKRCT